MQRLHRLGGIMDTCISWKTPVLVAVVAAVLAVLGAPAAAAPPDDITLYPVPGEGLPVDIAAGPDGNLWVTESTEYIPLDGARRSARRASAGKIGRITPAGVITEYPLPNAFSTPHQIAAGPDGNLWFTDTPNTPLSASWNAIGRITPDGDVTEFPLPMTNSGPNGIAPGPDGNLWFTETWGGSIGRITPEGTITKYPLPKKDSLGAGNFPAGITAGPDGNLWFTETVANSIGRITPAGVITEYGLPTANSGARGITAGPDGNLWFTETAANRIGRITPDGTVTEYPLPSRGRLPAGSGPHEITAGPDGNLWFTETFRGAIGRVTRDGTITEYPLPLYGSGPLGLAVGPDDNLWFTDPYRRRIGRISPTATPEAVKWICPINVTLHKPAPKKVGKRTLTDKITTNNFCLLPTPVVRCQPLADAPAGEKASCDARTTRRGKIRVNARRHEAVRVTVIVRARPKQPKPAYAERWRRDTWRKVWLLR